MGFASGFTGSANNSQTQNTAIAIAASDLSTNTTTENLADNSRNLGQNATLLDNGASLDASVTNNTTTTNLVDSGATIALADQQGSVFGDATSLANGAGMREASVASDAIASAVKTNQDAFGFGSQAYAFAAQSLDFATKAQTGLETANQDIASLAGGRALLSDNNANSNTLLIAGGVVAFLVVAFLVARANK